MQKIPSVFGGRGPAGQQVQGVLRRRVGLGGVGEEALAWIRSQREGLERQLEVPDDWVVEAFDAGGVDPNVMGCPADPELVAAGGQLADQVREPPVVGIAAEWEDWGLVIATRTGRPVNHANARRSWNRILRKAGVDHRGIHHMRHAYGTMLAEQGVHERVAQQLAGHADARMTREIYTHVTAPMFAADAISQAVDDAFGSSADANGSNGSSDPAIGSKNGPKTTKRPASSEDPPPL